MCLARMSLFKKKNMLMSFQPDLAQRKEEEKKSSNVALPGLSGCELGLRKCLSTPVADDFNKYALHTVLSS